MSGSTSNSKVTYNPDFRRHIDTINAMYEDAGRSDLKIKKSDLELETAQVQLIVQKQYTKALENALFRRFTKYFEARIENGEFDDMSEKLKEANDYIADHSSGKFIKTDMMYITIRPKEEFNNLEMLELFMKKISKVPKKKWITNYLYVIEQSGKSLEELGKGFHCHMLIHHDSSKKKLSEFSNEIMNTIKECGVEKRGGLDLKNCIKDIAFKNFRNYLLGKKDSSKERNKDKAIKQEMDIPFREKYEIQPYYTNDIEFFENYSLI